MHIEHVAIWTKNLEQSRISTCTIFRLRLRVKYTNPDKGFESRFLTFFSGARLELMQMPSIPDSLNDLEAQFTGLIHLAISVGSEDQVDSLTARLRQE